MNIENAISPDYSSVVDIAPADAPIWMQGITLTRSFIANQRIRAAMRFRGKTE